jgi:hypothetical protein
VQVFNVTLQETGERLALAPVDLPYSVERRRYGMQEFFGNQRDLRVVTAARLSANFPIVSPQSRPDLPLSTETPSYHSSDGGYYDNYGVVTALECLEDLLEDLGSGSKLKRIALVQIWASPGPDVSSSEPNVTRLEPVVESQEIELPPENYVAMEEQTIRKDVRRGGLLNGFFGPFETLYNVRTSSQAARNMFELKLASELWCKKYNVKLSSFVFGLSDEQPLSWHLTMKEKKEIEAHWPDSELDESISWKVDRARNRNERQLYTLQKFLRGEV